jgi:hypothetical protein
MIKTISVWKILFYFLVLIPPVYIIHLVNHYGIVVPLWDQWGFVPLLEKAYRGTVTFYDLCAQANEHRILFPRLIMLSLALPTRWNILYELYASILIASCTLLCLYFVLRSTIDKYLLPYVTAVFSWFIFSTSQGINWTWGWQMAIFLNILGTVGAVWAVSYWPGRFGGIIIAIVFSVISSFSFNNGLLTWPVVSLLLMLERGKKKHIALYILAAVLTISFYYSGYTKPIGHPSLLTPAHHPYDYLRYILAYVGAPIGAGNEKVATIAGLLSIIIFWTGLFYIWRFYKTELRKLLPWFTLGLYSLLSACATGVGRLGLGVDQALVSRYITISTLFIISTIVVTTMWINNYRIRKGLPIKLFVTIAAVSILLIISYILSFSNGLGEIKFEKAEIENSKACIENEDAASDECLKTFFPNPDVLREVIKIFKKIKGPAS